MSTPFQVIGLMGITVIWLGIVIPGASASGGINWQAVITMGLLPVGAIWGVFIATQVRKARRKQSAEE